MRYPQPGLEMGILRATSCWQALSQGSSAGCLESLGPLSQCLRKPRLRENDKNLNEARVDTIG
jgi:hypothetical protein